jgi:hypothetical protein
LENFHSIRKNKQLAVFAGDDRRSPLSLRQSGSCCFGGEILVHHTRYSEKEWVSATAPENHCSALLRMEMYHGMLGIHSQKWRHWPKWHYSQNIGETRFVKVDLRYRSIPGESMVDWAIVEHSQSDSQVV